LPGNRRIEPIDLRAYRLPDVLTLSLAGIDPWGRPYQYRAPGRSGAFDVLTLGRDNAPGGTGEDRDVIN
jgi:type II secretory pathway pseudopilin PulG